ncbi:hypothetical protein TU94_28460 [Streptomyces cyaneogriseus subsp. noncyanogenus]|uniref:CBM-cenC domain-containing protein n=1 Tax=Streptomyces cyaneogriseus subsp. noncyanogenus TaxID=477245 RepID=A0A0C5G8W8_9ACTN|nr:hypothetical protein [Streptomyces cyaneogriseus]AJP04794.1 hypothetical protein TU94_28460 [Streptomyces cyaneogriseus subsp. noncyanogenus]
MAIPGNFLSPTTESIDPNTSGWAPKSNCTLAKGVGGRNGDGCLVVKSVASGETQARTVSSYPITPGTVYYCFADAAGSVPERIGIRWLTAAGAEISVTWSLTTMAASANWHRVSAAGPAPVNAATAQVLLSSTETAAGVNHYWENVYLGLPIRILGNLFDFNTESAEIDLSGWAAGANATISRQAPTMGWTVTNYTAGGQVLAVTASAAGTASAMTVNRPAVTPGTEYIAYAYLQPPTTSSTAWIELRFYDSTGAQVGVQRSTLAPPGTGMYRQRASMVAPAAAATCAVAAGLDGATAGQVLRLETVAVTVAPKLMTGSVLPYADSSFEQGVADWATAAGVATLARTTPWGSSSYEGAYALAVTSSTATTSTVRSARWPVTPNVNWRAQAIMRTAGGTWASVTVRVRWYDAGGADLGASTGVGYVLAGTGWYACAADAVAPEAAAQAAVELMPAASVAGSVLHVDAVTLWQVLPQTAVEARPDDGYVLLTLRELPLDYLITVYRVTPDGKRAAVRGAAGLIVQQVITSDVMLIEDHEAPLGQPVNYRIEVYTTAGAVAFTRSSEPVTLALDDINTAWIKDPGNPQRNCLVMVERAPDWQRPIEQAVYVVRGRRNKVILSGRRQGLEGDLAIWTRSDAEREALHLLLDSGNVLLWQAASGMGVADMYVAVGEVTEARVSPLAQEEWRAWSLPLVEQDMPVTTGVNGARGRTWQDVVTEFATAADLLEVYATSEALLLDRRTG